MSVGSRKFGITEIFLSCDWFIEITKARFDEIGLARQQVLVGLYLEEKFDMILENYAEIGRELLSIALRESLFRNFEQGNIDRRVVNRRLMNLLATARLYVDHYNFADVDVIPNLCTESRGIKSAEYDSSPAYRIMESLRNYAQHRDVLIANITYHSDRETDPALLRWTIAISIDYERLRVDQEFNLKEGTLQELEPLRDEQGRVNAMPIVREYVQSLGRVHERIRSTIADALSAADSVLRDVRTQATAIESPEKGSLVSLSIVDRDHEGLDHERHWVSVDLIDRRLELERKNKHLGSIASRYVSSQTE
jgi:hypothetical protein